MVTIVEDKVADMQVKLDDAALTSGFDLKAEINKCLELFSNNRIHETLELAVSLEKLVPDDIDLNYILGICYSGLGDFDKALTYLEKCVQVVTTSDELYTNLALIYDKKQDVNKAVEFYQKALALNPNSIAAINNLGNIYNNIGDNLLALEYFNKLVAVGHDTYYVYNNIALVYKKLGKLDLALDAIQKSLASNPSVHQPYHNAALIFTSMGHKKNAVICYEMSLKFAPEEKQVIAEYRDLCVNVCAWDKYDELDSLYQQLTKDGVQNEIISPMSNIQKSINLQENLDCAVNYTKRQVQNILAKHRPFKHDLEKRRVLSNNRRLRLGYLSSDIKDHPVSHLMRGVFRCHDRAEFEVFLYSSSEIHPNDKSGYRQSIISYVEHFVDVRDFSNLDVANRIYNDEIDILIDLNGHTGVSRIDAVALKPAPIQISYLGYIGSMGADFIDYIISDQVVTAANEQIYYTEKFLYMPNCYQANDDMLEISKDKVERSENLLPENEFVFCSFNQTYKIDREMFGTWMNILKRVPNSVLWLYKGSIFIDDDSAVKNLQAQAGKAGINPNRLIFAEGVPIAQHLKRVALADLALDTRIYNGGTITSHTLWAGVPVLTLKGGHFASRMAASILTNVGMEELITHNLEEYENLAVSIATDAAKKQHLKKKLRDNIKTKPLFNTKQFTKDYETLLKNTWNTHDQLST